MIIIIKLTILYDKIWENSQHEFSKSDSTSCIFNQKSKGKKNVTFTINSIFKWTKSVKSSHLRSWKQFQWLELAPQNSGRLLSVSQWINAPLHRSTHSRIFNVLNVRRSITSSTPTEAHHVKPTSLFMPATHSQLYLLHYFFINKQKSFPPQACKKYIVCHTWGKCH